MTGRGKTGSRYAWHHVCRVTVRWVANTLIVAALLAGIGLIAIDLVRRPAPPPMPGNQEIVAATASPTAKSSARRSGRAGPHVGRPNTQASQSDAALTLPPATHSAPVRITIPTISVNAPLRRVGVADNGAIAAPPADKPYDAGWYVHSVVPGERGRSVIVGHLDSKYSGPAVFYRLGALRVGDTIDITRRDGITTTFEVDGAELHPRNDFPIATVLGPSNRAELRLITCGGDYDKDSGWSHNIIVSAHLVSWRSANHSSRQPHSR